MKIYNSLDEIDYNPNRILTVGSFDGIHKGHSEIIKSVTTQAHYNNLSGLMVTFDPHPQVVVNNPNKPRIQILTDVNEKIKVLETSGLDELLIVNFTKEFSEMSPENFIKNILYTKIGFKKIIIGYDHLYGRSRSGDYNLLLNLGKDLDFGIERTPALELDDMVISSTNIRNFIREMRLEEANYMLGYKYLVSGTVIEGLKLGRTIGFPTANIQPFNEYKLLPGRGVYLVSIAFDGKTYCGMANIGIRPTVSANNKETLEVNIFDFEGDIYGREVFVSFYRYIRFEEKFSDISKLKEQLTRDKENCINLTKMYI